MILIISFFFLVSEGTLPVESAIVSAKLLSNNDRSLDENVEDEIQEEKKKRKVKKRITHDDVVEQQFNALVAKQENLNLKKRKLDYIFWSRKCWKGTPLSSLNNLNTRTRHNVTPSISRIKS